MNDNSIKTYESSKDNNESNLVKKDVDDIIINDFFRKSIFYLMCIEYLISSCDGGIIPQQNKNLQIDFDDKENESKVGLFASIDYIGRITGALMMSYLINKLDRKLFFSGSCFFKAITLLIALFTGNYYVNLIARLLSGIPQTLLTGYGTIWTDQFGRRKKRSMMLPILQFSSLLGIMFGYGLGILSDAILGQNSTFLGWRFSFIIEGLILGILGVLFLLFPKIYFSSTFYLNEDDDYKGREKTIEEIELEC